MCTVTYIPQPSGNFILTSNRDEEEKRSPMGLSKIFRSNHQLIFPKDTVAGGTWIVASSRAWANCVLNGAFVGHQRKPPYRKSRGIMALEFHDFMNTADFCHNYDFEGIEPFTMVIVEGATLTEIRWDEKKLHEKEMNPNTCHIWSSVKLYSPEAQIKRKKWFDEWLEVRTDFSPEAVIDLHRNGGKGDLWNGFVMNRFDLVKTVSITSIVRTESGLEMIYHDLIGKKTARENIPFDQ